MDKFTFWQRWLFAVAILLLAMGLLMVGIGVLPVVPPNDPVVAAFWGQQSLSSAAAAFYHWVFGVWGATLAGWATTLLFLVRTPFKKREKWAWQCVMASLGVWYPLDTLISLYFGVGFNVALNTVILVLVLTPLAAIRKEFFEGA